MPIDQPTLDPRTEILEQADRCVMCGLCLPHCPTYALSRLESESPRGRIALALALARGQLSPEEPALVEHLDSCLVCRACEDKCPSKVAYSRIITAAREMLIQQGHGAKPGIAAALTGDRPAATLLRRAARRYSGSPLQGMVRRHGLLGSGRLARLERLLPAVRAESQGPGPYPATGSRRGHVQLFTGCTGELADAATVNGALAVLTGLGYAVSVPESSCCGAMDWHAGRREQAEAHGAETLSRFDADTPIIAIASGCAGFLHEYGTWLERPDAEQFAVQVREITAFLDGEDVESLPIVPLPGTVAVHEPCSLRHVLHARGTTARLLQRLGFAVRPLEGGDACCGAAGDYMLRRPAQADRLRAPHVEALAASDARYLVSANIGCALHLAAGAREAGIEVEVLHPTALIGRCLKPESAVQNS